MVPKRVPEDRDTCHCVHQKALDDCLIVILISIIIIIIIIIVLITKDQHHVPVPQTSTHAGQKCF